MSGLAVAGSMLLLGAALNVVRPFYLDALPQGSSVPAAGVVYDQLVSFIRVALRGVLVVALAVAAVAWTSSPRGSGAAARGAVGRGLDAVRGRRDGAGLGTGRLGAALAQYRGAMRVAVLGFAALGYLALDHPTAGSALTIVLAAAAVLLLLELLAAGRPPEPVVDPPTTAGR